MTRNESLIAAALQAHVQAKANYDTMAKSIHGTFDEQKAAELSRLKKAEEEAYVHLIQVQKAAKSTCDIPAKLP